VTRPRILARLLALLLQRNPHTSWAWERTDGKRLTDASAEGVEALQREYLPVGSGTDVAGFRARLMALIDREHPREAPPPACGQVWVDADAEFLITVVTPDGALASGQLVQPWPPPEAVLVAGPGAPWMDTSGGAR
jgi:hypothetical protein